MTMELEEEMEMLNQTLTTLRNVSNESNESHEVMNELKVNITPSSMNEVDALAKEVNDYLDHSTIESHELIELLESFIGKYNQAITENDKLKELLKELLGNKFMGNALLKVRENL